MTCERNTPFEQRRRVPNAESPLIESSAIGSIGTPGLLPAEVRDRRFQFADALSVVKGAHALNIGADYSASIAVRPRLVRQFVNVARLSGEPTYRMLIQGKVVIC